MTDTTAIDMHNTLSSEKITAIVEKSTKKLIANPGNIHMHPAIMLRGAPGVGKSTIVREVANRLGIGFIDVRLAEMERVDLSGLPSVEDGVTKWNVPAFWPRDPKSKGIILFDEITSAPSDVQVAAYSLINDRAIPNSDYRLPDGWQIVAAGNRAIDKAVVKTMSSALANRFMHFELEANSEDWCSWAVQHDIHPSVTGYIRYRPANLIKMDKQNLEQGWPSPRSWERVSNIISIFEDDEELLRAAVYGLIGNSVGLEFIEFHKLNKKFDDVLKMMTDPKAPIVIPERADEKYALTSAVSYLLWNGKDKKDQAARVDGFYRIALALSADFATVLAKSAMLGNAKVKAIDAMKMIISHKSYKEFAKKFGSAFGRAMNK